MPHPKKRASIVDVAKLAEVSYQTVSRVLNKPDLVAAKTRQRVENAIRELGYQPNLAAQMLKTNRSHLIGVVSSDSYHFGPISTLNAVHEAASQNGYGVQVGIVSPTSSHQPTEVLQSLLRYGVEGIIVITTQKWIRQALDTLPERLPVVMVAAGMESTEQVSVVSVNQYQGAQMAVDHLYRQGFREIAHLCGPLDWFDASSRLEGWKDKLRSDSDISGKYAEGDWSEASGYRYVEKLYPHLPESIFFANDRMALGAYRFFWEKGVKIPEDIAVVGFDSEESSHYCCPALTSIEQPFSLLGQHALRLLLDRIQDSPTVSLSIAPKLVIRESSVRGQDPQPSQAAESVKSESPIQPCCSPG